MMSCRVTMPMKLFKSSTRDGAAAVVPELLQPLAHGAVVVQVGDAMLWRQKVSNVHGDASFLMGRGDPPG